MNADKINPREPDTKVPGKKERRNVSTIMKFESLLCDFAALRRRVSFFIRVYLRLSAVAVLLLAAAPARAILPIQYWQASSGARVYFVENHDLPMLDISVEFPAGAGYDQPAKSGVASMTQRLLKSGAEGLSEDDVSRRVADIGAQLAGRFDADR